MDAKEALKIVQGIEEVKGSLPEDGLLVEEAIHLAIDALKKQIPVEPIESEAVRYGMGYDYHDWDCPTCGRFIAFEPDTRTLRETHHCECGQALKWKDA